MSASERDRLVAAWLETAEAALVAAEDLRRGGHHRASVSRSYYAAYAFAAALLASRPGVHFRGDREGPEHSELDARVASAAKRLLSESSRSAVRAQIFALYNLRIRADYHPHAIVGREAAARALQGATLVEANIRRILP